MADIDGASFLTGANAGFIVDLYARFLDDPASVDDSWRRFFAEIGDDGSTALGELRGPPWAKPHAAVTNGAATVLDAEALRRATSDSIRALQLIRAYRVRGHLEADLDPLGLDKRGPYPELDFRSYGFSEADLDREIFLNNIFGQRAGEPARDHSDPARDLLRHDRRRIHAHPGARPSAPGFSKNSKRGDPECCRRPTRKRFWKS